MMGRPRYPWKFHGAGAIECLEHHPGVLIYAGTCPDCQPTREGWERYPGVKPRGEPAITPIPDLRLIDDPYAVEG